MAKLLASAALIFVHFVCCYYGKTFHTRIDKIDDLNEENQLILKNNLHQTNSDEVPYYLKMLSFNVQIFGVTKMSKPEVVDYLVRIFDRYDVSMMMEIRDSSQESFPEFVRLLNERSKYTYAGDVGERLGRSSSKEQYGFIWRTDKVELLRIWQYPDDEDIFQRPPSVAVFKDLHTSCNVTFIPIHTSPDDTINEMNGLVKVYDTVAKELSITNAIIAGDFNAGCSYVCQSCWKDVELFTDQRFYWLVSSYANTTVASSQCPYDRVVLAGRVATKVVNHAVVFRYDKLWNVDHELVKDISDHYPVQFEIYLGEEAVIERIIENPVNVLD